jgi:hypothetical protein
MMRGDETGGEGTGRDGTGRDGMGGEGRWGAGGAQRGRTLRVVAVEAHEELSHAGRGMGEHARVAWLRDDTTLDVGALSREESAKLGGMVLREESGLTEALGVALEVPKMR